MSLLPCLRFSTAALSLPLPELPENDGHSLGRSQGFQHTL